MNGGGGRRPGPRQQRRGGGRRPRGPRRPDMDHGFPDVDAELDGQMGGPEGLDRTALEEKSLEELQAIAEEAKIEGAEKLRKPELVTAILSQKAEEEGFLYRQGVLDVLPDGYGFLRTQGYLPSEEDVYISMSQIRRFGLRRGDEVSGLIRPPKDSEKYYALLRIERVNGMEPDRARQRVGNHELADPGHGHGRLRRLWRFSARGH